jgi:hypothetical protein
MLEKRRNASCVIVLGSIVVGALATVFGCSEDAAPPPAPAATAATGSLGESCTRRADCETGLACVGNKCTRDDAGVALGAVGETCAARADCEPGLACIDMVCTPGNQVATDAGTDGTIIPKGPGGRQGESCLSSSDCASPLVCVSAKCAMGDFTVAPSGKECLVVQCDTAMDCCPKPNVLCQQWKMQCEADRDAGAAACAQYNSPLNNCVCDVSTWKCDKYKCLARIPCDSEIDCSVSYTCYNGECVNCVTDADCLTGQACSKNTCTTRCESSSQCPALHSCENSACVKTGCNDDRECIALEKDALAICQEGKCFKPCQRDIECSAPSPYLFKACVEGYCKDVGCKTDEECKIRLGTQVGATNKARCLEPLP